MGWRSLVVVAAVIAPVGCGGPHGPPPPGAGVRLMADAQWRYVIEFDRLPERLGRTLEHPDIGAAGLVIRVRPGLDAGREVAIEVDGDRHNLSCCEFDLHNGGPPLSSYSFAVRYTGGSKFLTMRAAEPLRPDARMVVKCGCPDAEPGAAADGGSSANSVAR